MVWFLVPFMSFLGSLVQTVTGFGSAIIMLLVLPSLFNMLTASTLTTSITVFIAVLVVVRYWRYIDLKLCAIPAILFSAVTTIVLNLIRNVDLGALKLYYGIFLILLAIFFIFFSGKISAKPSLPVMILCSVLSGIFSGMFSVGGPPLAIYFSGLISRDDTGDPRKAPGGISYSKALYSANVQFTFLINNIFSMITRIRNGYYTSDLIPYTVIGLIGIYLGYVLGIKVLGKINGTRMKQMIYIVVGVMGVITVARCLL